MLKFKPLSTKEYINLCIENYNNAEEEIKAQQNKNKDVELEIQRINESVYEMQASKTKLHNDFQQFSEGVKSTLLSECLYKVFNEALGIHKESTINNNIKRSLINTFIKEQGVNTLLNQFKNSSYILHSFSTLVNESYAKILSEVQKDKPETFCIDKNMKDEFFDKLNMEDVDDVVTSIRSRVASAMEEFIQTNINNKIDIEDTIKEAQKKIENAKSEELRESYEQLAKRQISLIKNRTAKNVFSAMVSTMSEQVLKEEVFRNEYMLDNKLNIDKIVERCEILYTFLEMVNTMKIANVNENYIKEVLDNLNA